MTLIFYVRVFDSRWDLYSIRSSSISAYKSKCVKKRMTTKSQPLRIKETQRIFQVLFKYKWSIDLIIWSLALNVNATAGVFCVDFEMPKGKTDCWILSASPLQSQLIREI